MCGGKSAARQILKMRSSRTFALQPRNKNGGAVFISAFDQGSMTDPGDKRSGLARGVGRGRDGNWREHPCDLASHPNRKPWGVPVLAETLVFRAHREQVVTKFVWSLW